MNIPTLALFGNRNPISLPMCLAGKSTQPLQMNQKLDYSILSQLNVSVIGLPGQKPLQFPLNVSCSDQRIVGPGALFSQPDLGRLQNIRSESLVKSEEDLFVTNSLAAKQLRNLQAETHSEDAKTIKEMSSLIIHVLNSKKELEEKLQTVLTQNEMLQRRLYEYEQKELAKMPPRKPIEYIFVPKKKRTRRPATQISRSHKCPIAECQKSYGSNTSLNLHVIKKHPEYKMPEKETSE